MNFSYYNCILLLFPSEHDSLNAVDLQNLLHDAQNKILHIYLLIGQNVVKFKKLDSMESVYKITLCVHFYL